MAELDKRQWLSSDTFDFENEQDGKVIAIKSEPGSKIKIKKREIRSNLKIEMEWFCLKSNELKKICDWLNKVPIKPRNQSEE